MLRETRPQPLNFPAILTGYELLTKKIIINIAVEKVKYLNLLPLQSNWYSPGTAVMTFVNEDSGARFSDFSGLVEIRPHNDPEAWSSPKLQSVLMVD